MAVRFHCPLAKQTSYKMFCADTKIVLGWYCPI